MKVKSLSSTSFHVTFLVSVCITTCQSLQQKTAALSSPSGLSDNPGISDLFSFQLKTLASVFWNFFTLYVFWWPENHIVSTLFLFSISFSFYFLSLRAFVHYSRVEARFPVTQTYQCWLHYFHRHFNPDMDNIHECANGIHRKFSELAENFLRMVIYKTFSLLVKIQKNFVIDGKIYKNY